MMNIIELSFLSLICWLLFRFRSLLHSNYTGTDVLLHKLHLLLNPLETLMFIIRNTLEPINVRLTHDFVGSVHAASEEFKNAALFLRFGLSSTLIVQKTELFENVLPTGGI